MNDGTAGTAGLLRIAAVPVATWLRGGSPELFERLRALDERSEDYRARARAAADDIGTRLVPHPRLGARERATALGVRRALHNASGLADLPDLPDLPGPAGLVGRELGVVAGLAARVLPEDSLAPALHDLIVAGRSLRAGHEEVSELISAEETRLLAEPWRLLHADPALRNAVRAGNLAVYQEIAERVAAGEPWTGKRMRQRSDYLWRMITRAATRATPRGWLAHVALLPVEPGGWAGEGTLPVSALAAAEHSENLHRARTTREPAGDSSICLAALTRLDGEHLRVWTVKDDDRSSLGEVRLRRTTALDAVIAVLSSGPQRASRVIDSVAGQDPDRRRAVAGLLAHLAKLSALQVNTPVRRRFGAWRPLTDVVPAAPDAGPDDYVDVYRRAATGIAEPYARRLETLIGQALRVVSAVDRSAAPPPLPSVLDEEPRPLLELAAEAMRSHLLPRDPRCGHGWPSARRTGSGYGALLRLLDRRMDDGETIDLDAGTLDALGMPAPAMDWPIDALLRPLRPQRAGGLAILDQLAPAGILDARFAPALASLHPRLTHVEAYRRFLACRAEAAGIPFVEVLAPPMEPRAANAGRRPGYTGLWTGDPDRAGYMDDAADAAEAADAADAAGAAGAAAHLPLSRITLRIRDGVVVAECDGARIWPVMHTTRVVPPLWDTIIALLMLASPQPARNRFGSLGYTVNAWSDRAFVPRITIGGELILTPAQWRLTPADLWHHADRRGRKLAAMERLRRTMRLPRLVSVTRDVHDDPVAIDLNSLNGMRMLDRLIRRQAPHILVRELLADPPLLPVRDEADEAATSVAELLLRLPVTVPVRHGTHDLAAVRP